MQQYAIIVAGGTGSRMQQSVPKQFLLLHNKPVIYYSIHAFLQTFSAIQIIIVVHKDYQTELQQIIEKYFIDKKIWIAIGGQTRFHSVQNGLALISDSSDGIVYVHDAARPFITTTLLQQLQANCMAHGNAIPIIPIAESLRQVSINNSNQSINRDEIKIVQTPQVFKAAIIKQGFTQAYQPQFTDEASVCEPFVGTIYLSAGIEQNIKITTPLQLQIAELWMQDWKI
jgi:2-C-methyl-D-erythritol 4-phosphate cytidylyltransferase